jgi:glutamate dehydrogenase (NAD(P)+)
VVDIPLGGGKGGIVVDTPELSLTEQERLCRGYIRQLHAQLGPDVDVPAPDVGSNNQHMLWMMDEYEVMFGGRYPGVITGKPVGMGGSLGRMEATGYGMIYVLRDYFEAEGIDIKKTTASFQGFGKVAEYAAELYVQLGGKIITVSSFDLKDKKAYTYRKKSGCDVNELRSASDKFKNIVKEKAEALGYEVLDADAWLSEDVDILMPSALENQITPANFPQVGKNVRVIVEGANGPTTPDCDALIRERGIMMLPDFLVNAGGVTCSYFEQVQNNMNYYWSKEEALEKVNAVMSKAFKAVYSLSKERGEYMRDAAYIIAIERVNEAVKLRGWI